MLAVTIPLVFVRVSKARVSFPCVLILFHRSRVLVSPTHRLVAKNVYAQFESNKNNNNGSSERSVRFLLSQDRLGTVLLVCFLSGA